MRKTMEYPFLSFQEIMHISSGLLSCRKHPEYNLWILNYTPEVQYKQKWDETLLSSRGKVVDEFGKVIARPFRKFFNIGEHASPLLPNVPYGSPFKAYEKLDGSLGICFYYKDKWNITTRGSFCSKQAEKAQKLLKNYDCSGLNRQHTYLFEILSEESRVVVRYEKEELVLLGAIETSTGKEIDPEYLESLPFRKPSIYNVSDISELSLNKNNFEGYVIKFDNGLRVKVKLDEYLKVHRIICGFSANRVWEALSSGVDLESDIINLPDEFHAEMLQVVYDIQDNFSKTKSLYEKKFAELELDSLSRKEKAIKIQQFCKQNTDFNVSTLYSLLDSNEAKFHKNCWNLVKPPQ